MTRNRLVLLSQFLIFLIPLNIYMWGDWLIVNAQWALFRYQQSAYGNSLILGHKDLAYISLGQTTGIYNIAAALFWTVGAAILFIGLCITIFAVLKDDSGFIKKASYFTLCGGIFLSLSALSRFFGGFSIPIGIPIILYIGWRMYQDNKEEEEHEEESGDDEVSVSD
ncbi:MAG TPA: hypothetical protein VFC43_05015 [Methanoregula sp.]|nr:hypothetical protein [Methanoregula sp.]